MLQCQLLLIQIISLFLILEPIRAAMKIHVGMGLGMGMGMGMGLGMGMVIRMGIGMEMEMEVMFQILQGESEIW